MKDQCNVTNKSAGFVIYNIPELGVRREFAPHETKHIKVDELDSLSMMGGGKELIYNYLFINDDEVLHHLLNKDVEPEYYLTEAQIPSWMESCSIDEFKDALDFAPNGTKDLIKQYAVSKPLNDYDKREAIKVQLGFDVSKAIENMKPNEDEKKAEKAISTPAATGRRSSTTTIKKPVEAKE